MQVQEKVARANRNIAKVLFTNTEHFSRRISQKLFVWKSCIFQIVQICRFVEFGVCCKIPGKNWNKYFIKGRLGGHRLWYFSLPEAKIFMPWYYFITCNYQLSVKLYLMFYNLTASTIWVVWAIFPGDCWCSSN